MQSLSSLSAVSIAIYSFTHWSALALAIAIASAMTLPVSLNQGAPNQFGSSFVLQQQEESEGIKARGKQEQKGKKMDEKDTWQTKIAANAELVTKTFKEQLDIELTFDRGGIEKIDGFIDRNRQSWIDSGGTEGAVNNLGAFIGECFVREMGGEWVEDPTGGFGVKLEGDLTVFPFNKVRKHIEDGEGDSVLSLHGAVQAMLKAQRAEKDK